MLGRIRIDPGWEDPTVTLYLINHSVASIIKRFDYSTMEHIRFIAGFLYYKCHNPITWAQLRTKYNRQVIRNGQIEPEFAQLLVPDTFAVDEKHGSDFIFKKYSINYLCKLKCTYDYYKMMAWLEELLEAQQQKEWLLAGGQEEKAAEYERNYPWIRYQLKWLGKKYDPKGWIHTNNHVHLYNEVLSMLETYCDAWFTEEQEMYFRNLIRRYGASIQPVNKIANTKCSRVQQVNDALTEWGIPYRITKSHKSHNGKQRIWWIVWIPVDSSMYFFTSSFTSSGSPGMYSHISGSMTSSQPDLSDESVPSKSNTTASMVVSLSWS